MFARVRTQHVENVRHIGRTRHSEHAAAVETISLASALSIKFPAEFIFENLESRTKERRHA
jgi:hypothetical protein